MINNQPIETSNAKNNINIAETYGLGESGATSHFVLPGTPTMIIKRQLKRP